MEHLISNRTFEKGLQKEGWLTSVGQLGQRGQYYCACVILPSRLRRLHLASAHPDSRPSGLEEGGW